MSSEFITLFMFATMMVLLMTGQRVFGVIGFVGSLAALLLWGNGAFEMPFNATFAVLNWYPLITVPFFVFMGYMLSESGIASNLYRMFHVWFGGIRGGLALGTIGLMVVISSMNGLSVAGMAIGATVALPELLKRGYNKIMVTGVIQAGSSLGILIPPSVVLVLYAMIARQPVLQLWLAGIGPGLLMATLFAVYIYIRCRINPELGPTLPKEELDSITWAEKFSTLRAGLLPLIIFGTMMGLFLTGVTSLVESSVVGALLATLAALFTGRMTKAVWETTTRNSLMISCMFLWIILAALCFSSVYDGLGAVKAIEKLLIGTFDLSPWTILILMLLSFVVLGMFLDDTAMLVIVAPLYIPLVKSLGFNAIWFGILYTITCQIAYITPPFGYNLFMMRALAPSSVTMVDIYKSIVPFFFLMVLTVIILMIFPQIALWLPNWYSGR
ncbi:TRAP transporter large permease subunit [Pseudochrobactrum algeriensis]|uniref:Tripartite ATP-independent transporter DctM subunit n=1 Tax=Pseudochrobactrum saccharolyticum TaxID=354352 RepID=A0A7W8EP99_9HYPH|nr:MULTISPECIES: TRAP transporter large permease subunit [Pseudochrobactrum]MBX8783082.1 TRAP transporter large permease subunit [Ochrobactrum sp. GRS2]MBX8811045.1 TRAP transporter large permease subunit [Ochrobactrum sp. MR34]KAB0538934.1 TRAP transporter large permease subunit [Pseudochrobactrum saccharolyticum]MBB5091079.1 tripartite ATP-independent transporter DctM subunit [Pseudochrobactrum saccharolyticum]MDP8249787.1 TRAP transporter large permease subunit [Pseudochrobactrum saccharoly